MGPPDDGWPKCFCSACGSALWSRSRDEPRVYSSASGRSTTTRASGPQYRQFVAYAAPWEPLPDDGLPRYDDRLPA